MYAIEKRYCEEIFYSIAVKHIFIARREKIKVSFCLISILSRLQDVYTSLNIIAKESLLSDKNRKIYHNMTYACICIHFNLRKLYILEKGASEFYLLFLFFFFCFTPCISNANLVRQGRNYSLQCKLDRMLRSPYVVIEISFCFIIEVSIPWKPENKSFAMFVRAKVGLHSFFPLLIQTLISSIVTRRSVQPTFPSKDFYKKPNPSIIHLVTISPVFYRHTSRAISF